MKPPKFAGRLAAAAAFLMVPSLAAIPTNAASASKIAADVPAPPAVTKIQPAPQVPAGSTLLGSTSGSTPLAGAVALAPGNEAGLQAFISAVTDKSSPSYHQYLAPGAFAARFGPSQATISAVEQAIRADGLTVSGVSSDGLLVNFSGTAAQADTTFHTHIDSYRMRGGWTGRATTGPVSLQLPSNLTGAVAGVIGLNDLLRAQSAGIQPGQPPSQSGRPAAKAPALTPVKGAPTACSAAQADATQFGGLTDNQIANAYGAFGLYRQGDLGQGQHIAVYELEPFSPTDIQAFDTCYFGAAEAANMSGSNGNLSGSRLQVVPVDGGVPAGPGSGEAVLDVEDVSAIAPKANIDVYEAPNTTFGGLDEYATIVNSDVDQVITSSWGLCEQFAQLAEPGLQEAENYLFQQAAAQGQTVLSAEGDTGNDSCNELRQTAPPAGQNLLSVLDPASQPYVVSVGGTTIDNATQPPSEHVWNDGAQWGGGGGGISESWQMPSWQRPLALTTANATDVSNAQSFETSTANVSAPYTTPTFCDGANGLPPGTPCREVPDVSAQADEFTGAVTIYASSFGGWLTIGGTSSATPLWASMLALVNASSSCSADTVPFSGGAVQDAGFASPILYGVAANPAAYKASFNDITSGNNDIYGLDNGLLFPARAGYDMASGLGSPQLTTPSGGNGLAYYMCEYASQLHPPVVTAVSPTYGPVAGGQLVSVTGNGFENTSGTPLVESVQVGSVTATAFTVQSSTSLQVTMPPAVATTPPGSPNPTQDGAGPAHIVVTLDNGLSSAPSAASLYEYVDEAASSSAGVPSVTGLSPYGGLATGPARVTVLGSGFEACANGGGTSCPAKDLTATVETVDFGNVAATNVKVVSPYELTATPPKLSQLDPTSACPVDNGAPGQPLSPTSDVCQVEVTVTTAAGTSTTASPLPPYEGALGTDSMGAPVLPPGCNCEYMPQPDEYDYSPAPTVTGVSTGTVNDLPANAPDLASEFGGASSNLVEVTGTGMDPLTFSGVIIDSTTYYPVVEAGTYFLLEAPGILASGGTPTVGPYGLPFGFQTLAGTTSPSAGTILYAGVPQVSSVVNTSNPNTLGGVYGAPDTGGAPLRITGAGFLQAVGPIGFVDAYTPYSLGTQYTYTLDSDTQLTTQSVAQNPAIADTEVCSNTGCSAPTSAQSPPSTADELVIYPPGAPVVTAVSPSSGPPAGGTPVVVSGQNLGCAVSVGFGTVQAETFSNQQAILDCGQTTSLTATSPPGAPGSTVPVKVETAESVLAPSQPTSDATFSYTGSPGSGVITSPDSATAQVGTYFSFKVTVGGVPPIWVSESGPLPRGIRLNHDRDGATLQGTPQRGSGGIYYFSLVATNGAGSQTQPFTLTVDEAPGIRAPFRVVALVGAPFSFTATGTGYPTPALSISSGTLPAGLAASDGSDGMLVVSGTPEPGSAGSYPIAISAANATSTATRTVTLVVVDSANRDRGPGGHGGPGGH